MKENSIVFARLDSTTHKKIKEFALMNQISMSEIFRVLIENSKMKLKNVRLTGSVIWDSRRQGKVNKSTVRAYVTEEAFYKLTKMRLENNVSCSEIMRCLIEETDFNNSKLKFKNKAEVYREAVKKNKKK